MNTPKLSFKITRRDSVKNILGDSYDDIHNPFPQIVNVGIYVLAHVEGMQENLSQEEDVSDYTKELLNLKDYNETT